MPRYKCHKEVRALRIVKIEPQGEEGYVLEFQPPYVPFVVKHSWYEQHKPAAGGYYVVYEDGFSSYSPADAFEKGYTLITAEQK